LDQSCEKCRSNTQSRGKKNEYPTYSKRKTKWNGHILRTNCLIKHVIQENIRGTNKRERRRQQLLDDF